MPQITLACRNYDRTQAILRDLVKPKGVDLRVAEVSSPPELFTRVFRGEYEAGEMSLAELVYHVSRGGDDLVGVPVFPSKMFRHSFLFYNPASGIRGPESLSGRSVGFPRLVQTACVWMRGLLIDEYGVSPKDTHWCFASIHHWTDGEGHEEVASRDGSIVRLMPRREGDENDEAERTLVEGEIDALGTTRIPQGLLAGDQRIRRLFENSREVEASYFRKTGIFPIMHTLVVRRDVAERHPELPAELFWAFSQARRLGQEWLRSDPSLSLAWKNQYLQEERELFRGDPWAYGLEKNARTLGAFLSYCYAQGVSAREMSPRELFHPSTWGLTE